MKTPEKMLFGEGCQTVNCEKMAKTIGAAPTTLKRWRKGQFPPAFKHFAKICAIRELTDAEIGQIVRAMR